MTSRPKKSLGQHFLTDRNILGAVADAAYVGAADVVVEIGPGRGALTTVLAERAARVIAVELDTALAAELRKTMPANVDIVEADARGVIPEVLLGGHTPYKLVGNLPYYAALPILRAFLESDHRPTHAAILVQLEVARQLCAEPGGMSLAALGVQLFGMPRIARRVSPGAFNPPPKVTSAVVGITVFDSPAAGVTNVEGFFTIARAGFSTRRKQLRNALANGLGVDARTAAIMLTQAGIDPKRRAESLSVVEWARLAAAT
jgi:16S rRNA (adenine1518-N6/adenine1519-N6)-dimethyltransferase